MAGLRDLDLGRGRIVPARWLTVRTSRSGGPGGQHVNKTETKVDLRLDLGGAEEALGPTRTGRIRAKLGNRIDATDHLVVVCDEHRSQVRNLEGAIERMTTLLREALVVPKVRRKTRPTRGAVERRLQGKRQRGQIKRWRSGRDEG